LRRAAIMAAPVGLVAGMWAANAFSHATHDYCMVAPVFIAIAALTSASCLLGVPRAAIAGMVASIAPIAVKLALYDSWGMRALALMLVLMTAMQIHVVLDKFKETLAMLEQKHQAVRASLTDPLTGLDNRLAFMRMLEERLRLDRPVMLVLADLDGLKIANDTHGHLAGDAILTETARRMKRLGARALCVARLGGDEFAMLYDVARGQKLALGEIAAIERASPPHRVNDRIVSIGASFGTAIGPLEGASPAAIINPPTPASMPTKPRARTPCRVSPQRLWRV
jgi:diguanylate cyclase (GGDEF)-like protein